MPVGKLTIALIGAGAIVLAAIITATATILARPADPVPIEQVASPESASGDDVAEGPTEPAPETTPSTQDGADSAGAWLSDLEPIVKTGLWYDGAAVIRGETYLHSFQTSLTGVQGDTVWAQFPLNGSRERLTGLVGIVDGGHSSEKAVFEIVVDDAVVQEVEVAIGDPAVAVDVSLVGAQDLVLRVTNVSNSAYWANPAFADFRLE